MEKRKEELDEKDFETIMKNPEEGLDEVVQDPKAKEEIEKVIEIINEI